MARRRFTVRDIDEILAYWHETGSINGTARSLGVNRRTVRKYVSKAREKGYVPGSSPPPEGWRAFVREKLPESVGRTQPSEAMSRIGDLHQEVVEGLEQTTAATVWQRLRDERGLRVSLNSFYRYLRRHIAQGKRVKGITIRRGEAAPGEVVEVDFGTLGIWWDPLGRRRRRVYAFIMVLGHSRHMFVWITLTIDRRAWVQAHIEAFEFFGGVPRRVVLDNLKSGVLKPDIYDPKFNRTYEELSRHYGFIVDPARARTPREKPVVERMVPYARGSFWKGREFGPLEEMQASARRWCLEVAGRRVHGTTGLQPLAHFREMEEPALKPLPLEPFEMTTWTRAKVGPDCHIQVGRSLYSIPYLYVGKTVDVRLTETMVQCFLEEEVVKVHSRVAPGRRNTDWRDYPPEKARILRENPEWCRRRAAETGESVAWVVGTLLDGHAQHYLRQARGVLRLIDVYGRERLAAACQRARAFGDPSYRTVKGVLERGLDRDMQLTLAPTPSAGAFLRGPEALLSASMRPGEGDHE